MNARRLARTVVLALAVPLVLALVALTGLALLLGSESGTRWALAQAQEASGDTLRIGETRGSLLSSLSLRALQLDTAAATVTVARLELSWTPLALLRRELRITGLSVSEAQIRVAESGADDADDADAARALPTLPVDLYIDGLQLRELRLIGANAEPFVLRQLDAALALPRAAPGSLRLQASGPLFGITLAGRLDAMPPHTADLQLAGSAPTEMGDAQAALALRGDAGRLQLDGRLTQPLAAGLSGTLSGLLGQPAWDLALSADDLRWPLTDSEPEQIRLSHARLRTQGTAQAYVLAAELAHEGPAAPPGRWRAEARGTPDRLELDTLHGEILGGVIQGSGALGLADERSARLTLGWQDLSWPADDARPEVHSGAGTLSITGTATAYRLTLSTDIGSAQWPRVAVTMNASGNESMCVVDAMQLGLLGGGVDITGTVGWTPAPHWNLAIAGDGLDLAQLAPEFPSQLALAARSRGEIGADARLAAELEVDRLRGTLRDQAFELTARLDSDGQQHRLRELQLAAAGGTASASAVLAGERVQAQWALRLPDLAGLLPRAGGQLKSQGRLAGTLNAPVIRAQLSGTNLAYADSSLGRLQLTANLDPGAKKPGPLLSVRAEDVRQAGAEQLDALRLDIVGLLGRHRIDLSAAGPIGGLELGMDGGAELAAASWSGRIAQLLLNHPAAGRWQLRQPAGVTLAAAGAEVQALCLDRDQGGELCATLSHDAQGASALEASAAFPLALAHADLSSSLSGTLAARRDADGTTAASALVTLAPGHLLLRTDDEDTELAFDGGEARVELDGDGLHATAEFALPSGGTLRARAQAPGLRFPAPPEQPLSGRLNLLVPDLRPVTALLPVLADMRGSLTLETGLAGSLARPELSGALRLDEASVRIPEAGLKLRQMHLRADSDRDDPQRWRIEGGVHSGDGRIQLSGDANIAAQAVELQLRGSEFLAADTREVRARISPELNISATAERLRVRGSIDVPQAAFTPHISIGDAVSGDTAADELVPVSADVVLVNDPAQSADAAPQAPPLVLDSIVTIRLGNRVRTNAAGFRSRFEGALRLTHAPGATDLMPVARGELRIVEGRFRSFNQDLKIERGQIIFNDVPADEPELSIRGVREIHGDDRVRLVGAHVTGTPSLLDVELFSEPMLEREAILAYFLTGRAPSADARELAIGSYIRPDLYLSYSRDILRGLNSYNLRYNITRRYGVEGNFGEADNAIALTLSLER